MAVEESAAFCRLQFEIEFAVGGLVGQKLLKQHGAARNLARGRIFEQRRNLVAEAQQAARLKPYYRQTTGDMWRQRRHGTFRLAPRFIGLADRQKSTAAA